jgi:hypothetical protein
MVAPVQRREDALYGEHAGQRVAERDPHPRRRLPGVSGDVPQPAHRLGHRGVARLLAVRPGLAVAGHPGQDDARVHRRHPVVAEVPPLQRPGPEVLDDDVGALDQAQEQLLSGGGAQVERDEAFPPGVHRPPQLVTVDGAPAPRPQRVGPVRGLDLDDVGAEVGEQPSGERPGDDRAQLQHPHALQRPDTGVHGPTVGRASDDRRIHRARARPPGQA